ncbi:hypothetical protein VNO77_19206 [Canavalia gladiata]|uniref:Uncharacterized protein n=1 Tax=Canavalia gladiata TaxID=3824 RepID=A0AAN9LS56_CANGL
MGSREALEATNKFTKLLEIDPNSVSSPRGLGERTEDLRCIANNVPVANDTAACTMSTPLSAPVHSILLTKDDASHINDPKLNLHTELATADVETCAHCVVHVRAFTVSLGRDMRIKGKAGRTKESYELVPCFRRGILDLPCLTRWLATVAGGATNQSLLRASSVTYRRTLSGLEDSLDIAIAQAREKG